MTPAKWLLALLATTSLVAGAVVRSAAQKEKPTPQESAISLFTKAQASDYVGSQACAECHSTEVDDFHHSGHASFVSDPSLSADRQGCESCHGPGKQHIAEEGGHIVNFAQSKPDDVNAVCLRCHQDVMTAPQFRHQAHAQAGLSCVSCHAIHPDESPLGAVSSRDRGLLQKEIFPSAKTTGKLLKADEATLCGSCHQDVISKFRSNSHHPVPEGRLVCSDCHNIHPRSSMQQAIDLGKNNCISCHADKAGPFVYEHDPVAGWVGRGCLECHDPHGSHNPDLLNAFSRGLCAQCHTDKLANHFPGRSCWNAGCHVALHGSNSDPNLLAH